MATNDEIITGYLRDRGFSATGARLTVFDTLAQATAPLAIQELATACIPVDRSSVYRTVDLFERLGVIIRIQAGWKYRLELSDRFRPHHHHATCVRCGTSLELTENDQLERLLKQIAGQHGFELQQHQIELTGLCQGCRPADVIA